MAVAARCSCAVAAGSPAPAQGRKLLLCSGIFSAYSSRLGTAPGSIRSSRAGSGAARQIRPVLLRSRRRRLRRRPVALCQLLYALLSQPCSLPGTQHAAQCWHDIQKRHAMHAVVESIH
jgi:hypothetical protein